MKIAILGVNIDKIDRPSVLAKITEYLASPAQHYIVTVNPEFVVAAQKNAEFKKVLNAADLATCDGVGLTLAAKFLTGEKLTRVTGVDLVTALLNCHPHPRCHPRAGGDPIFLPLDSRLSRRRSWLGQAQTEAKADFRGNDSEEHKFYLLGGTGETAQRVKQKYPNARIVGAESGGEIDRTSYLLENNDEVIGRIKKSGANILLVAFGQVKEEIWLARNLARLPDIKVAIGVGGTFDFLSGKIKRAPRLMRALGLEWLFRLLREPRRFGRIWNATVKFSWLVLKNKLINRSTKSKITNDK